MESAGKDGAAALLISCDWPQTDLEFYCHCFANELRFVGSQTQIGRLRQQVLTDYPGIEVISSRCFRFGGMPALEFQLKTREGPGLRRMLFAPHWTYVLSVAGSDLLRHDQSIKHFLNSIQVAEPADASPEPQPETIGRPREMLELPNAKARPDSTRES
jgi:hypothetical protein